VATIREGRLGWRSAVGTSGSQMAPCLPAGFLRASFKAWRGSRPGHQSRTAATRTISTKPYGAMVLKRSRRVPTAGVRPQRGGATESSEQLGGLRGCWVLGPDLRINEPGIVVRDGEITPLSSRTPVLEHGASRVRPVTSDVAEPALEQRLHTGTHWAEVGLTGHDGAGAGKSSTTQPRGRWHVHRLLSRAG
jgi:hypothetical protein